MRVRIIFNLKNRGGHVPFYHQFLLAQFIKGVLLKGESDEFIHYNLYNFSGIKGQTKVSRVGLHYYSSKVTLVLSAPNADFIDYFLKQLFTIPQVEIGNLVMEPDSVEKENTPVSGEELKYICISPMVLAQAKFNDDEGKKFIPPTTDIFSDLLYESTITRMQKSGLYTEEQTNNFFKFQIVPDKEYLEKIEANNKKFARIYSVYDQDVKYEVRGYTFPFKLYAAQEVQEFLFTCGMGAYTHKGFGMLDLAHKDESVVSLEQYKIEADFA